VWEDGAGGGCKECEEGGEKDGRSREGDLGGAEDVGGYEGLENLGACSKYLIGGGALGLNS
jgi:hypothetical protein